MQKLYYDKIVLVIKQFQPMLYSTQCDFYIERESRLRT